MSTQVFMVQLIWLIVIAFCSSYKFSLFETFDDIRSFLVCWIWGCSIYCVNGVESSFPIKSDNIVIYVINDPLHKSL